MCLTRVAADGTGVLVAALGTGAAVPCLRARGDDGPP